MNSKEIKQLRGQIRQIVKELLPDILKDTLIAELHNNLASQLRESLIKIDERQKDLQAYMIRNSAVIK